MSGFELEPVDGGTSIPLPEGETHIGRGPFLGVSDKRVSRHHGLLDIAGGQLRIKPTHQNPCFFQPSLDDPPEPLEKDRWHDLRPGNVFSLLPGKYVYRVVSINVDNTQSNSQGLEEEEPIADVPAASTRTDEEPLRSPELNGQRELTQSNSQKLQESPATCPPEKEEDDKMEVSAVKEQEQGAGSRELVPEPEQRKRVLPAWMMQVAPDVSSPSTSTDDRKRGKGKAPPTQAKKPRPRKARSRSASSEESEQSQVQQTPKRRVKRLKSEEDEEEDAQPKAPSGAETRPGPSISESVTALEKGEGQRNGGHEARPAKRRRGADAKDGAERESQSQGRERARAGQEVAVGGQEEDSAEEGEASGGRAGPSQAKAKPPPRPPCPYGKSCYRKNPVHFQECSHPGDSDYAEGEEEEGEEEEDDDRPECPYGTSCYRKNPQHKKEYKHTRDPDSSPPARKKGGLDEEDEGEEEDWDDDNFINDDSGDEDSDYVPPESDDEDIKRLKKEAQAFLRRKR